MTSPASTSLDSNAASPMPRDARALSVSVVASVVLHTAFLATVLIVGSMALARVEPARPAIHIPPVVLAVAHVPAELLERQVEPEPAPELDEAVVEPEPATEAELATAATDAAPAPSDPEPSPDAAPGDSALAAQPEVPTEPETPPEPALANALPMAPVDSIPSETGTVAAVPEFVHGNPQLGAPEGTRIGQPSTGADPAPDRGVGEPSSDTGLSDGARRRLTQRWRDTLDRCLVRAARYPSDRGIREQRLQGDVHVAITFGSDGAIESVEVARSSGHSALDEWAASAVREIGRCPQPPVELGAAATRVTVPIQYILG